MVYAGHLSHSGRSTFNECRFKYRCRYVDKIKEKPKLGTGARNYGNYIHKVYELGWKATDLDTLAGIALIQRPNFTFPKSYDELTPTCLQNYWKLAEKFPTENQPLPEWRFKLEFPNDINHIGVVDRQIVGNDGGILIIDWKTGKREENKVGLYKNLQLQGYATAIHCKYQIPASQITCAHFYPRTGHFITAQYSKAILQRWVKGYINDVWTIRKAKKVELLPEINQFCDWCDYRYACPKGDCKPGTQVQVISENKIIKTEEDKTAGKLRNKSTENIIFTPDLF